MPLVLGGDERLEEAPPGRRVDAGAGVLDVERDHRRRRRRAAHRAPRRLGEAAYTAFSTRLTSTWRSWTGSPSTAGRPSSPSSVDASPPAGRVTRVRARRHHLGRARTGSRASGRSRIMSSRLVMMPLATPSCSPMRSTCFRARSSLADAAAQDVERGLDDAERVAQVVADASRPAGRRWRAARPAPAAPAGPRGRCGA